MTIIAWDGKVLAADKSSTSAGYSRTVTKIHIVPEGIVGFAGSEAGAMVLKNWFETGRTIESWPATQRDADACASAFFVDWNGVAYAYGTEPYPTIMEDAYFAMGSGRDYALAALHFGHSATMAVEVASKFDIYCGQGCDILNLKECRLKAGKKL